VEITEGDRELYLISEQQLPCANCGNWYILLWLQDIHQQLLHQD
jgi:hypothetical protein